MYQLNAEILYLSEKQDHLSLKYKNDRSQNLLNLLLEKLGYEYKEEKFEGLVKVKKTKA